MIQDPWGAFSLMRLNHLQPPFNDVRIRRAVLIGGEARKTTCARR